MKEKPDKMLAKEVKEKTKRCLESRKNANYLISIISLLQTENKKTVLVAIQSVNKLFTHYLDVDEMYLDREVKETNSDITKEEQYKLWLRERYVDVVDALMEIMLAADPASQPQCVSTLMKFVSKEGKHPLNKVPEGQLSFPVTLFNKILSVLLSSATNNEKRISSFEEYLENVDVRYFTLLYIQNTSQQLYGKGDGNNLLIGNLFAMLQQINIKTGKGSMKKYLCDQPENYQKIKKPEEHQKLFTATWLDFLKLKLPSGVYRSVLVMLHEKVMPHMKNPLLLSDFLTESYNIGGAFSLLALNGLFILVHKYNLNYPDFYKKLYALFEPSVFHVKYKSRFFHLCDLFLSSTHLPAYLVAAFAKRLARISLTAPPSGLIIAGPFIFNLIHRHPSCKQLIDRPDRDIDYENDLYDPDEPDPAKCRALESCLWELKTLQNHYLPQVARNSRRIDQDFPAMESDISNYLDISTDDLFDKDVSKKLRSVAVTFLPPSGLLGNKEDKLNLCWTL